MRDSVQERYMVVSEETLRALLTDHANAETLINNWMQR